MSKKRILYCDDYVDFGKYFSRAAERLGHEPVFVDRAARAWELIQAGEEFDVFISDYNMPEMNGLEFLKLVRSHPATKSTPFVLLTGNDSSDLPLAVSQLGANFRQKGASMSWSDIITESIRLTNSPSG